MKRKWTTTFIFWAVFMLIATGSKPQAAGESHWIYLPMVARPGTWQEVGADSASGAGISNNEWNSWLPTIAIATDGMTYLAWSDFNGGNYEIYVLAWNGSSWVEVGENSASGGGISNNGGSSWFPSLAIAPNGMPIVAWGDESSGNDEIYVRAWNGSSWVEMGAGSAGGGGISNTGDSQYPSLAIAPDGTPIVAWDDESSGNDEVYIRAWNGSNWVEMGAGSASGGGISNNTGSSRYPSLAIAPDGTPYVAWDDFDSSDGDDRIYILAWNGSSWEEVGTGSASGGGISNTGASRFPSLAIAADGTPYVVWLDYSSGNDEIYVRVWNGSAWEEVGAGSASGGGISNNTGSSGGNSVVISPHGTPYVAWQDDSSENWEIYILAWNGSAWEEVGAGSASGGGISNNKGDSRGPSLAIARDGTPYLAWGDDSSGNSEIYVRWFK